MFLVLAKYTVKFHPIIGKAHENQCSAVQFGKGNF